MQDDCRVQGEAVIEVPLRVYPRRSKTILAFHKRITGHYHIAMAYVKPAPHTYRWEPHLIIDRAGTLTEEKGLRVVSGPVVLLRYKRLDSILRDMITRRCIKSYHLAPWGVPAILAIDARNPDPEEEKAIPYEEAINVAKLIDGLARKVRIVEV